MVSAMMLSSDEYSNVSVENGKLISDGDKNIVVGVAFPGLANDLNLKDLDMDIDIPETVTSTADVKDATVGTSITMASAELMNEFGLTTSTALMTCRILLTILKTQQISW